ncbi:MAG TPA: uracil-DNA glycosylase [Candidatus Nitrosotalea sp.]|nr:uracil-DNA glycosylase [Candidatus Nitrosotalea sp.]
MNKTNIDLLNKQIVNCKKCIRLFKYTRQIAEHKVKRFQNEKYWGKPLTGFGDIHARMLLVGLAPAAHGGNRTGRMFTGDSSGDWLARALFENGFANKSTSEHRNDGYQLIDAYITASVRCAPPKNKPTKEEFDNCFPYIQNELDILKQVNVIVCLGRIAFDTCRKLLNIDDREFAHGKIIHHKKFMVLCSYHPSKQNTQTGRLKWKDWNKIFQTARNILDGKT